MTSKASGGNGKPPIKKACTADCLTDQMILNGILAATHGKLTLAQASEIDIAQFRAAVKASAQD
jgi:hypothetical protein